MDLADFLLARITEDEAVAQAALKWQQPHPDHRRHPDLRWQADRGGVLDVQGEEMVDYAGDDPALHIARWDPARVLAECDAKRRIVIKYQRRSELLTDPLHAPMRGLYENDRSLLDYVLRDLAAPYADHPDYPL